MDLKTARSALGLRICDMTRAMGVHISTYNKWERKEQGTPAAAARLVKILLWLHENNLFTQCLEDVSKYDPAAIRFPKPTRTR